MQNNELIRTPDTIIRILSIKERILVIDCIKKRCLKNELIF